MNDNKIIHKNIKLENILLSINIFKTNKICFKIYDIGLSINNELIIINIYENDFFIFPKIFKGEIIFI